MAVKCPQCGREFKNAQALNIHVGRLHKSAKAAKEPAKAAAGNACPVCGRNFALAMHLGRHMKMAHGTKAAKAAKRPVGRPRGRRKAVRTAQVIPAAVSTGVNVAGMSVDQLLNMKAAIDARLGQISQLLRQAKM